MSASASSTATGDVTKEVQSIKYGSCEFAILVAMYLASQPDGFLGPMNRKQILDLVNKFKLRVIGVALQNQGWTAMKRLIKAGNVKYKDNGCKPSHFTLTLKGRDIAEKLHQLHCVKGSVAPIFEITKNRKMIEK